MKTSQQRESHFYIQTEVLPAVDGRLHGGVRMPCAIAGRPKAALAFLPFDRQNMDLQRDALLTAGVDARHLFEDKASGARDDRPGLRACLECLRPGDTLVVWKLDRLGRSLSHLLEIIASLRERGVGFRSLTEQMDTTTPHGELLFHLFGAALAQYERALTRERIQAGLAAARRRGRLGGRPRALDEEKLEAVIAALNAGASKAAVCRTFGIPRSTLNDTLARAGWTGGA